MSTDDDFMEISTFESFSVFSHEYHLEFCGEAHRTVPHCRHHRSRQVYQHIDFSWAESESTCLRADIRVSWKSATINCSSGVFEPLSSLSLFSLSYATAEYRPVCRLCRGCGWVTRIWNSRIVLQKQAQQQNSSDHSFVSFQWNGKSFSFVKKYTSTMTFQIEFRLQVAWVCILKLRHAIHSECMLYAINDYREDTNADTIIVIIEPNQTETPSKKITYTRAIVSPPKQQCRDSHLIPPDDLLMSKYFLR